MQPHPDPPPHLLVSWVRGKGVRAGAGSLSPVPPDHGPGPRCESLVDIYSQLQQEVGAAGAELEHTTRASLVSRLDEVLRILVSRCVQQAPREQRVVRACGWREEGREWQGWQRRSLPSARVLLPTPSSFLVEKQPPQVLKTQTKFQAGVRFLLGLRFLGSSAKPPLVRADMVTEKQARELAGPQAPGVAA